MYPIVRSLDYRRCLDSRFFSQVQNLAERLFGDADKWCDIPRHHPEFVKIALLNGYVTSIKSPFYCVYPPDVHNNIDIIEKGGRLLTKIDGEDYYKGSCTNYLNCDFCLKADEIDWIDARGCMTKAKR